MMPLRNLFKLLLLVAVCLLSPGEVVLSQTYNFTNYTVDDGLAQSQILSMCQDKDGYIWFGTNKGGLSKYDGDKFISYSKKDGLANNIVFSILQDDKGNMLFGTDGGLSIYDGLKFINYTEQDSLHHLDVNRVWKVYKDKKGVIWLGTAKGVYVFKDNKIIPFEAVTALKSQSVYTVFSDSHGNTWFGTITGGVFKYDGQSSVNYTVKDSLMDNFVRAIGEDSKGIIWLGTQSGIHKIKNGKVIKNYITDERGALTVNSFLPDNYGNMWVGTLQGVAKYDGKKYTRFLHGNGLASNNIFAMLLDREGNFWFSSIDNGVSKFSGERFINYNEKDGLASDAIQAVFEDSKGKIWIGSSKVGMSVFNGKDINTFEIFSKLLVGPNNKPLKNKEDENKNIVNYDLAFRNISCITEDKEGNIWMGTYGGGVSKYDGKKIKNFVLTNNKIISIAVDKYGMIWLGTKEGVEIIMGDNVVKFNRDTLFNKESINCIVHDKLDNIWFATDHGLAKYDGRKMLYFRKKDGFVDDRVRSIVKDEDGNFWFGTTQGIFRYDYKKFVSVNETNGLTCDNVYQLINDGDGNLWAGSNKGIDKFDAANYNKTGEIIVTNYGKKEGFIGLECNMNAGCKDRAGNIWFGTIQGVTKYNPKFDKLNKKEPITKITGIRLFFQKADTILKNYCDSLDLETKLPVNLVLPYAKNHITFDFIGISLTIPDKVKYQFKLEGADEDWLPVTNKNEATYSTLPPGEYTFAVKAMNNDGIWNIQPAVFHFVVLPPWYKTKWFYAFSALLLFGSVYFYISTRTKKLEASKRILEQQVQERTKELRAEKEKVEEINMEVIHQKDIIEAHNRDITDSINYALRIQQALLPSLKEIYANIDAFVLYRPKDIVSGDFYWSTKQNGKIFLATVDCTGHGVPGAFMSVIGNNLINQIVLEQKIEHPGEILSELNRGIRRVFKKGSSEINTNDGMDVAFCCVDLTANTIEFAGAQRPLYIVINGELEEVKGSKRPIGGSTEQDFEFENNIIPLRQGGHYYMSTDGFADQFGGEKGKKLMTKNFKEKLLTLYHETMDFQGNTLGDYHSNWRGDHEQVDDVLVIGFRV